MRARVYLVEAPQIESMASRLHCFIFTAMVPDQVADKDVADLQLSRWPEI